MYIDESMGVWMGVMAGALSFALFLGGGGGGEKCTSDVNFKRT